MPPKPKPQAPRPRKDESRRFDSRLLIVLGAGLLVGIVAVVLSVSLGGSKSKTPTVGSVDLSSVTGIEQHGRVLGNPKAKVTLTEYIDMTCPICRDYTLATFPSIVKRYVRPGKVKIEMRPINNGWPSGGRGRELVLAAGRQNKAWQLVDLLYQNQGEETQPWLTDNLARAIAAKIPGLDASKLFSDASSAAVQAEVKKANSEAKADGVRGTPTFLLVAKDGKRYVLGSGNPGITPFVKALDQALAA
jgi:protein-disulfide isomerase